MKQTISTLLLLAAALPLISSAGEPSPANKTAKSAIQVPAGPAVKKTIEAIYAERKNLDGKRVEVHGKVVKVFDGAIKEKNFLHIVDGTGKEGSNDLTVTSLETATLDNEVTVTGIIAVDRDFGAGYRYPVILEEAKIVVTKPAK